MNMLGKRIKSLREERNLNQVEFAKILNVSNSTLSQYETGQRIPSDEIKIMIANHFKVTIDYLLGISDIKNPYKDKCNNSEDLSPESQKELENYKEFLKTKEQLDKSKDEQSSALEKDA